MTGDWSATTYPQGYVVHDEERHLCLIFPPNEDVGVSADITAVEVPGQPEANEAGSPAQWNVGPGLTANDPPRYRPELREGLQELEITPAEIEEENEGGDSSVGVSVLPDDRRLRDEVEEHGAPVADAGVESHQVEHLPEVFAHTDDQDEDGEAQQGHAEPNISGHQQPGEPSLRLGFLNLLC